MKKLLVTSLLASAAACFSQVGRPTGDLIAVQRADEQVGSAVRTLSYQAVVAGLGSQVKKTLAEGRIVVVRPPKGRTWRQHRQTLLDSGMFESVEPDTFVAPCGTVNDPSFPTQWHLYEMSAQRAWDFSTGGNKIVAVVDGGVDVTHPDLMANLVPGYNVLTSQTQQSGGVVSDVRSNGHGTRIAGIAAAVGNNGIGVSGVGPNLKIMPVRVTNDAAQGIALRSDLLAGAQWAVQNGATSVNVSYSGVENADVEAMGAWVRAQGAFLVWAAGNANDDLSGFDHRNVTVVGGNTSTGTRWVSGLQGSGFGRGVDLFAPCVLIYTTSKGGGYGYAPAGTSFAVPQVAAALALMKDAYASATASELERDLLFRSDDLGEPGFDVTFSSGRLHAGRALERSPRRYRMVTIPFPSNFVSSFASSINNQGVIVGEATVTGSSFPVGWKFSEASGFSIIPPLAPFRGVSPRRIDEIGQIAVVMDSPTSGPVAIQGATVSPSGTVAFHSTISKPNSTVADIASNGYSVGWEYINGGNDSDGLGWNSPGNPVYFLGGSYIASTREYLVSVNRHGQAVGKIGNSVLGGVVHNFNTQFNNYLSSPISLASLPTQITDLGWISGYIDFGGSNWACRWRVSTTGSSDFTRTDFIPNSVGNSVNNAGEVVGEASNRMYSFDGPFVGQLQNQLLTPMPATFQYFQAANEVNDRGAVVGYGRKVNGIQEAVYLEPKYEAFAAASLGQLGETPSYIGSIPPALSVTFTDATGAPYPNANVNLPYTGDTGRFPLDLPSSVTGPYRMYLRCAPGVVPGYVGPKFLSRLYPPMGEPAAPLQVSYLPFSGPTVGGQPVILMYPGDLDASGEIDAADIDLAIASFGFVDGMPGWEPSYDVDGSGEIDAADIDIVIANFGLTDDPEP